MPLNNHPGQPPSGDQPAFPPAATRRFFTSRFQRIQQAQQQEQASSQDVHPAPVTLPMPVYAPGPRRAPRPLFQHQIQTQNAISLQIIERTLGEEIAVHDDFLCNISLMIMDKPVHLPGVTGVFDEVFIEQWINVKGTHPLTRAPLEKTQLVPHAEIAQRIADFMVASRNRALTQQQVEAPAEPLSSKRLRQE